MVTYTGVVGGRVKLDDGRELPVVAIRFGAWQHAYHDSEFVLKRGQRARFAHEDKDTLTLVECLDDDVKDLTLDEVEHNFANAPPEMWERIPELLKEKSAPT